MSKSRDLNIDDNPIALIQDTRRPKLESETGWARVGITSGYEGISDDGYFVGIAFENSWANTSVTEAPASWWLSESGEGRLRGKVTNGTAGTTIFTLPEEMRPKYAQEFLCSMDENGNIDLSSIRFRAFEEGDA